MSYVLTLIVFGVAIYFLKQFNQGQINRVSAQAKAENPFPKMAEALGLQFEETSTADKTKKTVMDVGSRVYGTYRGLPVDLIFATDTRYEGGRTYSYRMQRTITFTVKNSDKKFQIQPKSSNLVSQSTGSSKFDSKLSLTGNVSIPTSTLDYFGELGWMNLKLDGNRLVFHDNFMDQFQGITGGMKMLTAVHPIWKTSVQNWASLDIPNVKKFMDSVVDLAGQAGL